MPGQTVTLAPDQGTAAHLVLKDASGQVTTDRGTYQAPAWSVDNPLIVAINPVNDSTGVPLSCQVQSASPGGGAPVVQGSALVSVVLASSDPANHPELRDSFTVTIAVAPPPGPGPLAAIELVIDPAGPRLF